VSNDRNAKVASAARSFLMQWYPAALSFVALPAAQESGGGGDGGGGGGRKYCDLMDGRLFCRCLAILVAPSRGPGGKARGADGVRGLGFTDAMLAEAHAMWKLCAEVTGRGTSPLLPIFSPVSVRALAVHSGGLLVLDGAPKVAEKGDEPAAGCAPPAGQAWEELIAVESELLTAAMGAAEAGPSSADQPGDGGAASELAGSELADWRTGTNLHTDIAAPKSAFIYRGRRGKLSGQAKQEQRKQRYLANIHKYAASLQGNGVLHAKVIVVDKVERGGSGPQPKAGKKKGRQSGGTKTKAKSKKDLIQEANELKQAEKDAKDAEKKWKIQKEEISRQKTLESKFFLFEKYAKICRHPAILLDMFIFKLDTLTDAFKMTTLSRQFGDK
jgi:hypothetical protein